METFEGKAAVRKRGMKIVREYERRGEVLKNKDDEARTRVLKEKMRVESRRIAQDVTFHMSLLRQFVDIPTSLSFEKWLQDRDMTRKRESSETQAWRQKKTREIHETETLGRRFAVTEEIRNWIHSLYRQTVRERKMNDGKSTICSCRDTLAGPMEIRRVLLHISRDNEITTYAEFQKILGSVLFSMRASSHSVAEKIRKACSDSSELFFKTREEAESRLKTLKLKKDKEIRKTPDSGTCLQNLKMVELVDRT